MKKGGVREVNSFISLGPGEWTHRNSVVSKPAKAATTSSAKPFKTKPSTKDAFTSVIKTTNSPPQRIAAEVNRSLTKNLSRKQPHTSVSTVVMKPNANKVSTESSSPKNNLRNSIFGEKRAISTNKTTMNDVFKRKISNVPKTEKPSTHFPVQTVAMNEKKTLEQKLDIVNKSETPEERIETIETKRIENDDDCDYEDDFEDYESTFESYSGSESNDSLHQENEIAINYAENQKNIIEEEKKMDSGSYDLMYRKQIHKERNQLDIIKEALQKENISLQFGGSLKENFHLSEQFLSSTIVNNLHTELLLNFNAKSLQNFSNAKMKQRNSKTAKMIRIRGQKLLEMISLDTMDYVLYEQLSVPYDVFMRSFARQNIKQVYTQTNEDSVSCEVQTEEITMRSKWTQYPVRISSNELKNTNLAQLMAGVGDENSDSMLPDEGPEINSRKLNNFIKTYGEEMIAVLEENIHEKEIENAEQTGAKATEISSYISRIKYDSIPALNERTIVSIQYDPLDSSRLLTVHRKEEAKTDGYSLVCVWNIHQSWKPKLMLKSHGKVSCVCFVYSDSSHIVAGHEDGSLCVWNLSENDTYSEEEIGNCDDGTPFRMKLPSYNTAEVQKKGNHKSRVVQVNAVHAEERSDRVPKMVYSIEEENKLIIWTLSASSSQAVDIGSAPWSKIKFFVNQTMNIAQLLPKDVFQTTVAKVLSEFQILLGTNAGYAFKFNLYGKKLKKYITICRSTEPNAFKTTVTDIEVCPYNRLHFAVAYATGGIALFHVRYTEPICEIRNDSCNFILTPVFMQWLWSDQEHILVLDSRMKLKVYRFRETNSICVSVHEEELEGRIHSMVASPFSPNQRVQNFALLSKSEIQVHKLASLSGLQDQTQL